MTTPPPLPPPPPAAEKSSTSQSSIQSRLAKENDQLKDLLRASELRVQDALTRAADLVSLRSPIGNLAARITLQFALLSLFIVRAQERRLVKELARNSDGKLSAAMLKIRQLVSLGPFAQCLFVTLMLFFSFLLGG